MQDQETISTVREMSIRHPALTEASLRWQIVNATKNGLHEAGAIRRLGRRVYIIEQRYMAWLDHVGAAPRDKAA